MEFLFEGSHKYAPGIKRAQRQIHGQPADDAPPATDVRLLSNYYLFNLKGGNLCFCGHGISLLHVADTNRGRAYGSLAGGVEPGASDVSVRDCYAEPHKGSVTSVTYPCDRQTAMAAAVTFLTCGRESGGTRGKQFWQAILCFRLLKGIEKLTAVLGVRQ